MPHLHYLLVASLVAPTGAAPSNPNDLEFDELTEVDEDESPDPETDEALPFETVDVAELEAASTAHREDRVRVDTEPTMDPTGVEDPFPDRLDRALPRDVWIPGTVSLGLAGAAMVMSRLALRPDCSRQDDINSCKPPSASDIGVRGGRVVGAVGFSIGGAVFGAVTGRTLGNWLTHNDRLSLARKRRIAIGAGTSAVVLGTLGLAAGATLLGVGTDNAINIGRSFEDTGEALTTEDTMRANRGLDEIRRARTGMMILVAAPTVLAMGASLLVHRPRGPQLSVSPALSSTYAGLSLRVRF